MEYRFDGEIARIYSVNAALLLQYIWKRKNDYVESNIHHYHNRYWIRCSYKTLGETFPFLSKHALKQAADLLTMHGILLRRKMSQCRFDNTSYYAFTQQGKQLMLKGENELI